MTANGRLDVIFGRVILVQKDGPYSDIARRISLSGSSLVNERMSCTHWSLIFWSFGPKLEAFHLLYRLYPWTCLLMSTRASRVIARARLLGDHVITLLPRLVPRGGLRNAAWSTVCMVIRRMRSDGGRSGKVLTSRSSFSKSARSLGFL